MPFDPVAPQQRDTDRHSDCGSHSGAPPASAAQAQALPLWVAADLQDHLMVASNDLDRLQRLLQEAGHALMDGFTTASQQLQQLQPLLAGRPAAPAASAVRGALQSLGGAVTALQFQDMSQQLIEHTTRRLRGCADRLAQDAFDGRGDDEGGAAVVAPLPLRPNPVTQDEMDAGSVELF